MNSSSAYGNVLIAAPAAQPANNVPARPAVNDSSSREFQRAMEDVRFSQSENENSSITQKAKSKERDQVAAPNRNSVEKNSTRDKDVVNDKLASRSMRSAQNDAEKKDAVESSNNNAQAVANQSSSDAERLQSSIDKSNKDRGDELDQEPLSTDEIQSANVAFPLDAANKLPVSSGALFTLPGVESSIDGIAGTDNGAELNANLTTSSAVNTSGLPSLQTAHKNQSGNTAGIEKQNETSGLSGLSKGDEKVTRSLSDSDVTKTSGTADKTININAQEVDPVVTPIARGAAEPTLTQNTAVNVGQVTSEISASGKVSMSDVVSGSAKNALITSAGLNKSVGLNIVAGASLEPSVDQATDATTGAKNVFEKMFQAMTARHAGGTQSGAEQVNGNSGAATTIVDTPASFASAADSLNRMADSLSPAGRSFVVQTAIPVGVGQPQWSEAVGEKVLWLAAQNVTAAEIRLDPPDLGPMHVKVSVNQEQASVSFTSHHAGVREVLDQSLQRLRDMFSEQGLQLMNVDVSDKSFHHQQGEGKGAQGQGGSTELIDEESPVSISAIVQQRLVDHYA